MAIRTRVGAAYSDRQRRTSGKRERRGRRRPAEPRLGKPFGRFGDAAEQSFRRTEGRCAMSGLDWVLSSMLFITYIFLLFTVCMLTFQKGHIVLGILGIFIPFLWLIGAILPAKRGSRFDVDQSIRYQTQMNQM